MPRERSRRAAPRARPARLTRRAPQSNTLNSVAICLSPNLEVIDCDYAGSFTCPSQVDFKST